MGENGKWQIGFWVITVLVVGSFTWTSMCYSNNMTRIENNANKLIDVKDQFMNFLHKIDLRLSRIESKLGVDDGDKHGIRV